LIISPLGLSFRVDCADPIAHEVVRRAFGALEVDASVHPRWTYRVVIDRATGRLALSRDQDLIADGEGADDLVFLLEKDLTVELQRQRPELLFLHAAAVEWQGRAYVFAAESGSGKSTTTWGLLHHGFRYLSDELSPVDLSALSVSPYPHALCLKQDPPESFPLPPQVLRLGRTLHVPVSALPATHVANPLPVGGVFVLRYETARLEPVVRRLGPAEAAARLYPNVLNALAHSGKGLDAVLRIANALPCYALASAELGATCELIRDVVAATPAARRAP
jgi:hypothetical protein